MKNFWLTKQFYVVLVNGFVCHSFLPQDITNITKERFNRLSIKTNTTKHFYSLSHVKNYDGYIQVLDKLGTIKESFQFNDATIVAFLINLKFGKTDASFELKFKSPVPDYF